MTRLPIHFILTTTSIALAVLAGCGQDETDEAPATGNDAGSEAALQPDSQAPAADAAPESGGEAASSEPWHVCLVACTSSNDCALAGGGTCTAGACVPDTSSKACAADPDCIPYGSSWEIASPCTSDADCTPLERCIDLKGEGICVRVPSETRECSFWNLVEIPWKNLAGETITVCGRTSYVCDEGTCRNGCSADTDCTQSWLPHCDAVSKRCKCTTTGGNDSCAGGTYHGEVCQPDGSCGCGSDADCKVAQFDRCYGGKCGCSNDDACAGIAEGIAAVCRVP